MIKSHALKSRFLEKLRSLRYRIQGPLLCSDCFADHGLALEARKLGQLSQRKCPNCNSRAGAKLGQETLQDLAHLMIGSPVGRYTFRLGSMQTRV
jgi:hypothetical protein